MKFDDQFAIADYAIKVAPEDVMLDHHQQLLASCSIHAPPVPEEDGWPFVCKTIYGNISGAAWTTQRMCSDMITLSLKMKIAPRRGICRRDSNYTIKWLPSLQILSFGMEME